ncbi:MAG TPA: PQQ-dependent sugar dehydrogenase [Planctomycetota bacterium]
MFLSLLLALSPVEGPAQERVPWTTSRLTGSPEPPPPCRVERIWPALTFQKPVHLVPGPGHARYYAIEETGKIWSLPRDAGSAERTLFFDPQGIQVGEGLKNVQSTYALAFDPDFAKNRACYVMYICRSVKKEPHPKGSRVSRFRVKDDAIDLASEEILLEWLYGGHNGCDLQFGNDGMLYVSLGDGDRPSPPDPLDTGQDVSDLLSSILRLDVRGKAAVVPPDNPFVGKAGVRPEIWCYGFRNPWRMSFDRKTGELWIGDVGWERWELIFNAKKGGNYGWSVMEGPSPCRPDSRRGPTPILPPAHAIPHPEAASITGGFVYRGKKLKGFEGQYVYGDWESRRVWANPIVGGGLGDRREIARTPLRIVAFAEDVDGELLLVDHEGGGLWKLVAAELGTSNAAFPKKLSETGLFRSTSDQAPAAGVVELAIAAPRWADGAEGRRWLAVPGTGGPTLIDKNNQWPRESEWPKDSVFAKTLTRGGRKLETQVLHFDGLLWNAYAYAWSADQKDATLVGPAGAEVDGWKILPRAACLTCHNPWQGYALSFNAAQLKDLDGLKRMGFLPKTLKAAAPLADPRDAAQPLDLRARSYLAANCAHCHRFGGGGAANIDLRHDQPLDKMQAVNARPTLGGFDLPDPYVIAAGDPGRSTLLFRLSKLGPGHMPHLGSDEIDVQGLELLRQWIASLGPKAERTSTPFDVALSLPELPESARAEAIRKGLALPPGPSRDLFERFEPKEKRRKRLGLTIAPAEILALKGDAERGRAVFESAGLQCAICHKKEADALGAPLANLKLTRAEILDSILDPSKKIDPKFGGLRVQTKDGQVLSGVLVSRDDKEVVLRDAKGPTRIPVATIEREAPLTRSLMPDNLLQNLTLPEAADLLEYVSSLR